MLITDTPTLARFCDSLRDAPHLSIDTEFWRQRTYYPQLCLVQVGHLDTVGAIDPLAPGIDLSPLKELLLSPSSTKVLHAAGQDLEVLLLTFGAVPTPLFDTQVAAKALGLGDQPGYAALVLDLLGLTLDKGSQFMDWTRRPLSDVQLEYALDDVRHLDRMYPMMKARLEEEDKVGDFRAKMRAAEDPERYRMQPERAWKRVKIRRPTPRALAVLREVAAWREEQAMSRDIPRPWLLNDAGLIDLATKPPTTRAELAALKNITEKLARSPLGDDLLAAVARGLQAANREQGDRPRSP